MQVIVSVRVSRLVKIAVVAKKIAAVAAATMPMRQRLRAGLHHDQDADETQKRPPRPSSRQPLAQEQRRQHHGPERRGELQREDQRQRRHRDGVEPQVLAGEMGEVARSNGRPGGAA